MMTSPQTLEHREEGIKRRSRIPIPIDTERRHSHIVGANASYAEEQAGNSDQRDGHQHGFAELLKLLLHFPPLSNVASY